MEKKNIQQTLEEISKTMKEQTKIIQSMHDRAYKLNEKYFEAQQKYYGQNLAKILTAEGVIERIKALPWHKRLFNNF